MSEVPRVQDAQPPVWHNKSQASFFQVTGVCEEAKRLVWLLTRGRGKGGEVSPVKRCLVTGEMFAREQSMRILPLISLPQRVRYYR